MNKSRLSEPQRQEEADACLGAIVLPGVEIGGGAMGGAGARVSRGVPARHRFRPDGTVQPLGGHPRRMRLVRPSQENLA